MGCAQWVFEPNSLETSLIIVPLSENSLVKIIALISLNIPLNRNCLGNFFSGVFYGGLTDFFYVIHHC